MVVPKWGRAFSNKIFEITGSRDFTYYLFVTKLAGKKGENLVQSRSEFENCKKFIENLSYDDGKVQIKIKTFKEIMNEHFLSKHSTTMEATEIGRLLQIFRASDIELK